MENNLPSVEGIRKSVMSILEQDSTFVDGQIKGLIVHGAIEKIANYVQEYAAEAVGDKQREIEGLKETFITTLKVLRTMMNKVNLELGVQKADELLKIYDNGN